MHHKLKPNAVALHPAADAWMQGDRYGSIRATRVNGTRLIHLDKSGRLVWVKPQDILEVYSR